MIELKNIVKKYKSQTVLEIENLRFDKDEFVAIIGASGSGKSTLLNLIGGLDKPTSGEVLFDGENISKFNDRKLSKFRGQKIGFIFQFFYLQPFLTVLQNIEVAGFPAKIKPKERRFRAEKLASVVGLKDKMSSFPRELSGGQIQRVAIARSLINSPEILLADEPTGNLDSENSDRVIEMLELIQKQTKMTLIVVTHNEQIAARADRIIRLKDGKIC